MPYRKVGALEQCWYIIRWKISQLFEGKVMQGSPKRPCSYGCPNLTDGQYCENQERKAAAV